MEGIVPDGPIAATCSSASLKDGGLFFTVQ
jgi:hypothetical protein